MHEQVHARQWHSIDVFIIEAVMILNWFNPIVYFYRRAIKHIHEFIADDHATKEAANKADYAMLLLTQTFHVPSHNLVNSFFNHSLLKQRIIMLQKDKSQRIKLIKYGLSAPLFMLMLILTSATVNKSKAVKAINNKITEVLLLPPPTVSSLTRLSDQSAMSEPATMSVMTKNNELTTDNSPATVTDTPELDGAQIFKAVEKEPEFPGGQTAFYKFLSLNMRYPAAMRDIDVQGKVIVTFVVEKDGSLSNLRVVKELGYGSGEEALRVISLSPKWTPGYQNGKAVRVQYTLPIDFSLADVDVAQNNAVATDTGKSAITIVGYSANKTHLNYTVNGKEVSNADAQNVINGHNVLTVTVYKDASNPDKKAAVEITTFDKPGQTFMIDGKEASMENAKSIIGSNSYHTLGYGTEPSNKNTVYITTQPDKTIYTNAGVFGRADMTYIVDGKETSAADAKRIAGENGVLQIVLQKAPSPPNVKGVYEITTKKPIDVVLVPPGKSNAANMASGNVIGASGTKNSNTIEDVDLVKKGSRNIGYFASNNDTWTTTVKPANINAFDVSKALYIIDGKEIKPGELKTINPSDIKSMYILKDKTATLKYGSKGKNGVVLIFTKSYTGPLPADQPQLQPTKILLK